MGFLGALVPGFGTLVGLAQFLVGVAYPAFESFKAVESVGTSDDTQWLSYWVVYSLYSIVETFLWPILRWIPLYGLIKLAALFWLVAPKFQGAKFAYTTYMRPAGLAAIAKAKTIPQIEPYVKDFTPATGATTTGVSGLAAAVAAAVPDSADLKAHVQ